jgi:hypothetical protein
MRVSICKIAWLVSSWLLLTPFIRLFYFFARCFTGWLVWYSQLSFGAKLGRGFLPLVVPVILYGWVLNL